MFAWNDESDFIFAHSSSIGLSCDKQYIKRMFVSCDKDIVMHSIVFIRKQDDAAVGGSIG